MVWGLILSAVLNASMAWIQCTVTKLKPQKNKETHLFIFLQMNVANTLVVHNLLLCAEGHVSYMLPHYFMRTVPHCKGRHHNIQSHAIYQDAKLHAKCTRYATSHAIHVHHMPHHMPYTSITCHITGHITCHTRPSHATCRPYPIVGADSKDISIHLQRCLMLPK